jgi:hypothetical protein
VRAGASPPSRPRLALCKGDHSARTRRVPPGLSRPQSLTSLLALIAETMRTRSLRGPSRAASPWVHSPLCRAVFSPSTKTMRARRGGSFWTETLSSACDLIRGDRPTAAASVVTPPNGIQSLLAVLDEAPSRASSLPIQPAVPVRSGNITEPRRCAHPFGNREEHGARGKTSSLRLPASLSSRQCDCQALFTVRRYDNLVSACVRDSGSARESRPCSDVCPRRSPWRRRRSSRRGGQAPMRSGRLAWPR